MALKPENLKPYKSYVILEPRDANADPSDLDEGIIDDIATFIEGYGSDSVKVTVKQKEPMRESRADSAVEGISTGFVHYQESRVAAWSNLASVKDLINHLAVVTRFGGHVAVYFSAPGMGGKLLQALSDAGYDALPKLKPIDAGKLNSAFVNGRALTLWLSGIHRRVEVKPDNKVISGLDLRYALDPLGDQTYHFTSARCAPEACANTLVQIGVTPRKAHAWVGPTRAWDEFCDGTKTLLELIDDVKGTTDNPLPVLSSPIGKGVTPTTAYDLALISTELLAGGSDLDPDEWKRLDTWANRATYRVKSRARGNFSVDVSLDGETVGTFDFELKLEDAPDVDFAVSYKEAPDEKTKELQREAKKYLLKRQLLTVWYESGHTIKDGQIFEASRREMPFEGFEWATFPAGISVNREKPKGFDQETPKRPERIGEEDSLFCWVKNTYGKASVDCWLACDDGAGELADFAVLRKTTPPSLELIHVKAANSAGKDRPISASAYEVVTGQAVKNIRYLENQILADKLKAGLKSTIGNVVWHNDVLQPDREQMIAEILAIGSNIKKTVTILQPHLTKYRHDQARKKMASSDGKRLSQIDSLLLGAQASVRSAGAEFKVIVDDYTP